MPTFEDALCLLVILLAYGIAGHMDFEDAVLLDETQQRPRHSASTDCWSATPSPTGNSAAQVSQLGTEPQHDDLADPTSDPAPEAIALCPPVID